MDLSSKKCIPCRGNEEPLKEKETNQLIKQLAKGWQIYDKASKLKKGFKFKAFGHALEFVNEVGKVAEMEGHHPNIYLHSYNKVLIKLWTHKIGGLHENDFILASKIDKIKMPDD